MRVAGSKTGATRLTRPENFSPGNASTSTAAAVPTGTRFMSFSTRFATIRTVRMSTTDTTGELGPTNAPGSEKRLLTKPSTGDVDDGVLQRDLQFFEPRLGLLELCVGEIVLRLRRLVSGDGVVVGLLRQELAIVEALRPIAIGGRQLQIGITLTDCRLRHLERRFRLAHLLLDFHVFDLRHGLPPPDRVAQLHVDRGEPAVHAGYDLHRGRADQVPHDQDLFGHRRPLDHGELDRHGRPAGPAAGTSSSPAAGSRGGGPGRGSAAVVFAAGRGDAEGGTDDQEEQSFTHEYPSDSADGGHGA